MTIMDSNLVFQSATNCFASGADVNSTNIIDLAPHLAANAAWAADEGPQQPRYLVTNITTAVTGGTSMQVVLQTDSNTNFATVKTEPVMSFAVPVASLTAGAVIILPLPIGMKRYLRVAYRNVGANAAGACTTFIAETVQDAPIQTIGGFTVA